jgi:SAM-dependent methyltransferase
VDSHSTAPEHAVPSYEDLVAQATAALTSGWDFSFLAGRVDESPLSWDYTELALAAAAQADTVLDIDTGGGELLAEILGELQSAGIRRVIAVEPYAPNVPVAAERLRPLRVDVRPRKGALPVEAGWAGLVLNRHGALDPRELARVLRPGGRLLTQQVGWDNDAELNAALGAPPAHGTGPVDLIEELRASGLVIDEVHTDAPEVRFNDIAAVIYQLCMVTWQIPDFSVDKYDKQLRSLDVRIRRHGPLIVRNRRLLLRGHRP